ncbi:hypothetical protein [Rhodococcus marinonascens]|uniref:hypothetical protein n=1 Tax=Rhodococcus marinonascens TaxID=38311 RepID=UPI000B1EB52B|nr:hypothetical protein [Rhodococcus marinonascens]
MEVLVAEVAAAAPAPPAEGNPVEGVESVGLGMVAPAARPASAEADEAAAGGGGRRRSPE